MSTASGASEPGAAALRTADWRFLLPTSPDAHFDHLVLLGGGPGVVQRARALRLATRITDHLPATGDAQVVVAYENASDPVGRIAAALAPSGMLYLEVDRARRGRRLATPQRVARELTRAGLSAIALYAVEPDFTGPHAFVPLGSPVALAWYHRTFFLAPTMAARIVEAVRRAAIRLAGWHGAALLRRFAVVATRGGTNGAAPGVLSNGDVARCFDGARTARDAVVTTYGGDRVVLFPFARDHAVPLATVKVPKVATFTARTEAEQERARDVRGRVLPALAATIPEPRGTVRIGELVVACEQCAPGRSLASRARDRSCAIGAKLDDIARAMRWLADFHRATETCRAPWRDARANELDAMLREYASAFETTRDEEALFAAVRHASDAVAHETVPIVRQHRDFAASNILRDGDDLWVIDWEGAREGPGVSDAIRLATTWLFAVRGYEGGDDEITCLRDLFIALQPNDAATGAARAAVLEYARAMRLDPRLQPILLVAHRVELALRRHEQHRLQEDLPADAPPVTSEIRVVRALARETPTLFSGSTAST